MPQPHLLPPTPPPPGACALTLPCSTALWLLPGRGVWWPQAGCLLVADVHFGKAASFRHAGQPVPTGTTADNLARLDALLATTGAQRLVFLGDFLHARSGAQPALWRQLEAWRARHAAVAMDLVLGNHDRHAGTPPAALQIALQEEPWAPMPGVPVRAAHHPHAVQGHTVLAGHLHPTVALQGPARDRLRLPCFAWQAAQGLLVLPAFGAFTGSHAQSLPAGAQAYAIAGPRVLPVPVPLPQAG
ncbi:MAG: ligase-associated DNA damage response endonuclease PdeM [Burkholderiaceae bacterium]